jgi:low affinity Fe/Cu permease
MRRATFAIDVTVFRTINENHKETTMKNSNWYSRFAKGVSRFSGRPSVFMMAGSSIIVWIVTGPLFNYSDTWQLVINTSTTIVTFLMVFVIQSSQNRDTAAIQIKLDELIRATQGAHNALLDLEELEEKEIDAFRIRYQRMAAKSREVDGIPDTDSPEV